MKMIYECVSCGDKNFIMKPEEQEIDSFMHKLPKSIKCVICSKDMIPVMMDARDVAFKKYYEDKEVSDDNTS